MRPFALSRAPFAWEDRFGWNDLISDSFWNGAASQKTISADEPVICLDPYERPAFGTVLGKHDDALVHGHDKQAPPLPTTPLALTIDTQPGDTSTTATLTVDGDHVVSTLELPGDFDFFRVELQQGKLYNIGQYLVTGGPGGVPLADAYLELYDAEGNLIVSADGGGPNTPQGLDALLTYEAQYTGTYFINARSFDNGAPDGTAGDYVGDYEVFVDSVDPNDQNAYRPLYTPDQPMHSIDWGTQVDRTSRNPDGDNGPRDNGAPDTGVVYNPQFDIYGKNVITYYFAKTGDLFIDEDQTTVGLTTTMVAKGFEQWEKDAFRAALDEYEKAIDAVYIEVDNRAEADFKFVTYNGTPGAGGSVLGRMSAPNTDNEGQMEINAGDVRWTQEGVSQGGFYFPTLLHELGHGHGMAHPHDNGGRSSVMPGADGGTGGLGGGYGDWGLSQQVFTIMSYNDGWNEGAPYGARPLGHGGPRSGGITGTEVDHYGWAGTLTALDIAVLQDKYGVNEEYATGDDVYTIKDENGPGNFYSCIWDAAGTDEIKYVGARDANIDLRAATLKYEEGGGGWVSFAMGAWTGFTIANGVTIENATGGAGADTIGGNDAVNLLNGGDGNDTLDARAGNDTMDGGAGADTLVGGLGDDLLRGGAGGDSFSWSAGDGRDTFNGGDGVDTLAVTGGDAAEVARASWNGTVITNLLDNAVSDIEVVNLDTGGGADWLQYNGAAAATVNLGAGTASGFASIANVENVIGGSGNDSLTGNSGANKLNGGDGADIISGGGAADNLTGGLGTDTFVYAAGSGSDTIMDFDANAAGGQDFIDVSGFGINSLNFATRVSVIDAGAETVVRVDDVFITLKGVTGDGDNVITSADFLFG